MSVRMDVAPVWKYAVAGSILVSLMSLMITWQLTRQITATTTLSTTIIANAQPNSQSEWVWKLVAVGSSAMVVLQWVWSCSGRKSCQLDLTPPDNADQDADDDPIESFDDDRDYRRPRTRDKMSQAPTTYTGLRHVRKPKYQPLPHTSWG